MNKKALSLAICMAMAIPTASNALSLGEIESKSSLNQPFQGKINLLSTSVAEAKSLRVRVASPEVFNRVGIDRPAFLNSIRFRTTVQNGKPVILVSSNQPINEPFLNFLLEVSWPNGQLLKEYTVLLDPPVLMRPDTAIASNSAGVRAEPTAQGRITRPPVQAQPRRAQQQPRRVVSAATPARRAPARRAAATPRTGSQVRNYRVRSGDTLSKIADKIGYRGIRKDQMMVALFEKNRRAFSRRNMNNLKAGALITRPSLQEARALSPKAAKSQVVAQAKVWKQKRAELLAKKKAAGKVATKPTAARLEVVGKTDSGAVSSTSAGKGSVADLNKQLALLTESLTSKQNENEELKSRVSELESLLRKKNRLITLKSEQLAELQANMKGASPEATSETPTETPTPTEGVETTQTETETTLPEPVVANEGTDIQEQVAGSLANEAGEITRTQPEAVVDQTPAPVEVEPEVQPEPEVKPPANTFKNDVASESSFDVMSLLGSPAAMGIGGGSILALLGGLWFLRRRKSSDGETEDFSALIDDGLKDQTIDADEQGKVIDNHDIIDESEYVMHDDMDGKHQDQEGEATTAESENELEDLIQEADVYIVYGLHDQAESEIKRAIVNYPNNAALHAKLLENYKAAGDKEAFEETTKAFLDLDTDDKQNYWDEICDWGKAILPESKLYESSSLENVAGAAATGAAMVAGTAIADAAAGEEAEAAESEAQASEDLIDDTIIDDMEKIDLDEDLEDFDIDDILSADESDETIAEFDNEDDSDEIVAEFDSENDNEMDLADEFTIDIDGEFDDDIGAELDIDDEEFALDDDSLDALLDEELGETAVEEVIEATDDLDDDEFAIDDDSLDALLNEELGETAVEEVIEASTDDHDIANLNLELDSDDFDMIMPEDHAYKAASGEESTEKADDNLLADFDDNLSFLDLEDDSEVIEETQIETKIDLAKAYIDMGDIEGARSTLAEVMEEGNEDQKRQAEELLHHNG